jgi:hypothetical protein
LEEKVIQKKTFVKITKYYFFFALCFIKIFKLTYSLMK